MPPKKRGRGAAQKRGSKNKQSDEEPPTKLKREESLNSKVNRMIEEENKSSKPSTFKADETLKQLFPSVNVSIHEDYACMLNQTNISNNNNKFYVIQIAKLKTGFALFTKWGRVGEDGQNSVDTFKDVNEAIKGFEKKFKDKTKNDWKKRDNFTPYTGKYTLIEMSAESEDETEEETDKEVVKIPKVTVTIKCSLDSRTQLLIKLIFNADMFKDQMTAMNLDLKKMPLGKLTKSQILKGLQVLLEIEKELKGKTSSAKLNELSSRFYTLIPHSFGRMVPPTISELSVVDQKKEMIMTLTDIEIAQSMTKEEEKEKNIHPLDESYQKLNCDLEHVDRKSEEFKILHEYSTVNPKTRKGKLLDVWRVDRNGERERFQQHDDIEFRKLLWHGTNIAVVAAILKSGLRIMPYSGGLVGRGLYFASEHAKSSWYVCPHYGDFEGEKNVGIMFLTEVALGKQHFIKVPDSSLKAPPKGFNSIVARGQCEPNPNKDVRREYEGKEVIIPVGKPTSQKEFKDSAFSQSEYLIYKESQARLRYVLKFSF